MAAGKSKKWQLEQYRAAMGEDAAARQTAKSRSVDVRVRCKCTQSSTRHAEEVGPYHRVSCPMYAPS